MKVALIQSSLEWENPEANRQLFAGKIMSIRESVDLIVLPEMFTTGFTMNPYDISETMEGETVAWMKSISNKMQSALCGSIIIAEQSNYYNRLLFVYPSGEIRYYDKRHLFTLAGEDKVYTAGTEKVVVEYKGYRICLQICYDLRFPVFSRNTEDYDLLLYTANWPIVRIDAWDTLLKARSVENMCYTIAVNRIGTDNNHHQYNGHSQVVDFLGNIVIAAAESEGIFTADLDKVALNDTRQRLGFLPDRDHFTISG